MGHLGIRVVHHDVPSVGAVEVVLNHLHIVVSVLPRLVDSHQSGTQEGRKRGQGLVKLSTVVIGALPDVGHGRVEAEGRLVDVAAVIVEPYKGTELPVVVPVEDVGVEAAGLRLPVDHAVGVGQVGHQRHPWDRRLSDFRAVSPGHCGLGSQAGHESSHEQPCVEKSLSHFFVVHLVYVFICCFWS